MSRKIKIECLTLDGERKTSGFTGMTMQSMTNTDTMNRNRISVLL